MQVGTLQFRRCSNVVYATITFDRLRGKFE